MHVVVCVSDVNTHLVPIDGYYWALPDKAAEATK